jgi:hypothetical protein
MERKENKPLYQTLPMETSTDKKMCLTIDNCIVTLNFLTKPQDSVMTEVKRMLLSGQVHAKT